MTDSATHRADRVRSQIHGRYRYRIAVIPSGDQLAVVQLGDGRLPQLAQPELGLRSVAPDGPSWSDIAEWYDDLLQSGSGPHETALRCLDGLIPELDGSDVIDVARGQGIASRHLASRGARVIGIDSSAAMIDLADRHGTPVGFDVSYLVDDAQTLSRFEDSTFDGAVCQLGLMDIENLDAALAAINRVLKPGGWFAFVISHPCFLVPDAYRTDTPTGPGLAITGYFKERFWRSTNPEGVRRAGNYHRTLSTYINALSSAFFRIEVADEPHPNELLAEQQPVYSNVPIFFAARVRSIRGSGAMGSPTGDQDLE